MPLSITNSTVLRAAAFQGPTRVSSITTHTYLFLEQVRHQPNNPAGFPIGPTAWNGQPSAYGMDPRVVDAPLYRGRIKESLQSLPILSVVHYSIFPDSTVKKFDTLVLRADYNNSWIHWDPAGQARAQRIRDAWMKDSQRAMGWTAPHNRYLHLFLNGLYWGVYDAAERPDASFASAYFGGHLVNLLEILRWPLRVRGLGLGREQ